MVQLVPLALARYALVDLLLRELRILLQIELSFVLMLGHNLRIRRIYRVSDSGQSPSVYLKTHDRQLREVKQPPFCILAFVAERPIADGQ
jgi:hypothetical protein